jgi:hypothetical protein
MKFNESVRNRHKLPNCEGASSYSLSPEWELYVAAVTSLLSDKFYESGTSRIETLRQLVAECSPRFVARLAVYARNEMNLRSVPVVLTVELARVHRGDATVRKTVARIVRRADEITELLAYYQQANNRKTAKKLNRLSKQLQAGLQDAFNSFDEYQFAKYNRNTEIKLRDALFLVHPKAKSDAQQLLFDKIAANKLETPYTWETELSLLGQTAFPSADEKAAAFRAKWEELIAGGRLGYMALLRNLRNILESRVSPEHVAKVREILSSPEAVLKSKQLPFRFLAAYRELSKIASEYAPQVMSALEKAVSVSVRNIAGFDSNTAVLVACDVSSSMWRPVSPKSSIQNYDIGLLLGMLLKSRCKNAISGIFGDTWKIVNLPDTNVLAAVDALYKREGEVGYSTNGHLVVQYLSDNKIKMDKIMIFTDCQMWNSSGDGNSLAKAWRQYKLAFPKAKLYLFDLSGYGNTPANTNNPDVHLIAGWSDKIFDFIAAIDKGSDALQEIEQMEL